MSVRTRAARLALGTLAATATTIAVAAPAQAATTRHFIDTDPVYEVAANGRVDGTAYEYLEGGTVRVSIGGRAVRHGTSTGCTFARAIFTYADNSTSTTDSARHCPGDATFVTYALKSTTSKDVVKYVVQNMRATDSTAPGSKASGSTFLVGDAPDSLGTAARLDHEDLRAVRGTALVFKGPSDYGLESVPYVGTRYVRNHVVGDLTWSDQLKGSFAYVDITWTYADGSTSDATSAKLYRGGMPVRVDKKSSVGKEAVSVKVRVYQDSHTEGLAAIATPSKFGDYNGS